MDDVTLEMVALDKLHIDHAKDGGYARDLSEDRIRKRRKDWSLRKVGTIEVNRRADGSLWLIDGQHRREVAIEKGIAELPAVVHDGLSVEDEADLYLGKADAFPQQALAQFAARLRRGDRDALGIKRAVEGAGLHIAKDYSTAHSSDGSIVAVSRLERIYKQGGGAALHTVLRFAHEVWGNDFRAYQQATLEALYQFYAAYSPSWDKERVVEKLREAGVEGVHARAYAIRSTGDWPQTVDSMVVAMWRIYHEPKLRGHKLDPWTGKRTKPVISEDGVANFARGSQAALRKKAAEEREALRVVGG